MPNPSNQTTPTPPLPTSPERQLQWTHTRLRRRMLYGLWKEDLYVRLERAMGVKRAEILGDPDLSANVFASSMQSIAALYDIAPRVTGARGADLMNAALRESALWAQMQRTQRDVLGMREMLVRLDTHGTGKDARIGYTPISLDMAEVESDPERPESPNVVRQAAMRKHPQTGKLMWTWDIWDISDKANPVHKVVAANGGASGTMRQDVSALFGLPEGGLQGEAYPDRNADGTPFLRFVMYHAARTGCLLDSFHGLELVEGALNVGVLWTFFTHCVRHASWPQRWTLGAVPMATGQEGENRSVRQEMAAGPTFVLQLDKDEAFDGQPTVGQWAPASDPQTLAIAIGQYERRLAAFAGLNPSDIQRTSGDPRSGYALAIGREGRREAQRRYAPIFQPSDELLVATTAKMLNKARGSNEMDVDGWTVEYQSLPATKDEQKTDRENVVAMLAAGLIDRDEGRELLGIVTEETDDPTPVPVTGNDVLGIVAAVAAGTTTTTAAAAQMRILYGISPTDAAAMLDGVGPTTQ